MGRWAVEAKTLCPDPSVFRLVSITPIPSVILLNLIPLSSSARCPACGVVSSRIHSRYVRTPMDLPWSQCPVRLMITARRFFCDNSSCPRRIFTEPFPNTLERYARQTNRLRNYLLELTNAASAEAAARIARIIGAPVGGDSLIHRQRQEQFAFTQPRVIGVDEFAFRRGPVYGTLIVDLERHRPIAILESDRAEPFSEWLKAHPGIEIIARDRDESYASAGRVAAPGAIQVADRFHLVLNARDALKTLFQSRRWKLPVREVNQDTVTEIPNVNTPSVSTRQPTPLKLARWQEVQKRKAAGYTMKAIAIELGMGHHTVKRYLSMESPPIISRARSPTQVSPFFPYLQKRWEEGCHNGRQLYKEIVKLGYPGKQTQVYEALLPWREGKRLHLPPPQPALPLSRWVLCQRDSLKPEEKDSLETILLLNPPLAVGYHLKERFLEIINQGDVNGLFCWLKEAANSGLKAFQGMAGGIQRDIDAVINALVLPWSNGQCEGQICRVKLIKRAGYGRAKLDLLRQRVLHQVPA